MRPKYSLKATLQLIAFAFYPKTTLIACTVFAAIVIDILGIVMAALSEDSGWYNLVFALTTGAAGSFFVSFIVELSSNYKHNKLAWHELQDYYYAVTNYEGMKQVLMKHTPSQRAEVKAHEEFVEAGGVEDVDDDDKPKDLIQSTWEQIPQFIPALKEALDNKKAFLSETEINELKNIISDYHEIWHDIHMRLMISPVLYNVLNHPDETFPSYPQIILDDLPDWLRKHIAGMEGKKAIKRLVDTILSDHFLLTYYMKDYDISQHSLDSYHSPFDDEDYEPKESDVDDLDFSESEDEDEFRALHDAQGRQIEEANRPYVSWHISRCCLDLAESIDMLEKEILKKPYYGWIIKTNKESINAPLDDFISQTSYKTEKKRLEKMLKRQRSQ